MRTDDCIYILLLALQKWQLRLIPSLSYRDITITSKLFFMFKTRLKTTHSYHLLQPFYGLYTIARQGNE
jgi:hypothetical protein